MKEFRCRTRIVCGSGAVSALRELGAKRLLLVTDPYFEQNGTAKRIGALSGAEKVEIFSGVRPDPSVALAAEGATRVQAFKPDLMVALGGGSAMDCAKAMAYFGGGVPLAAIPTTSGSGSEVTDFAILTHEGVKHPLVDEALQPVLAILDDDLLQELPRSLIADAGFDVLSHALEAAVAKNATPITDALAKEAFSVAFRELPLSFGGRKDLRLAVHTAATMAGMAFTQAGLGLCHAMAHALGGMFHVPHGRLNAILLPAVIAHNGAADKYAAMARAAGFGSSADTAAVRELRNALVRLRKELELPATLAEAGIPAGQVRKNRDAICRAAMADPCCATNPIEVDGALVRAVLESVTGRG